jgi:hypothetical protein
MPTQPSTRSGPTRLSRGFPRAQGGFTIFEVAMAAAVMALAISTSIVVMSRGFNNLDSARCFSYASQIMQSELEKMRLTKWGNGTAAGNGTDGVTAYATSLTTLPIDASFTSAGDVGSRMTMTRIAENVHTGMIKVTLRISWKAIDGRTLSRSYVTYYGQNGLYDYFII